MPSVQLEQGAAESPNIREGVPKAMKGHFWGTVNPCGRRLDSPFRRVGGAPKVNYPNIQTSHHFPLFLAVPFPIVGEGLKHHIVRFNIVMYKAIFMQEIDATCYLNPNLLYHLKGKSSTKLVVLQWLKKRYKN